MNRFPQQLRVTKLISGNVQITDIANGRLIVEFVEDAALTLIQNKTGGIDIADADGIRFTLYTENFNSYQLPGFEPVLFSGTTAEAYTLLEDSFFNNLLNKSSGGGGAENIHSADFTLINTATIIAIFPAYLGLDFTRSTSGCFTLDLLGRPVCQISGKYKLDVGVAIEGILGNSQSSFYGYLRVNGVRVIGNKKTMYVRKNEYGGSASFSATLELVAGDYIDGEIERASGNESIVINQAYVNIIGTTTY